MNFTTILIILAGLFSIASAAFDWDWFMENRKTWLVTKLFGGRSGARVFYIVLGLFLVVFGFLDAFGVLGI